jgi:hypothetical protein
MSRAHAHTLPPTLNSSAPELRVSSGHLTLLARET